MPRAACRPQAVGSVSPRLPGAPCRGTPAAGWPCARLFPPRSSLLCFLSAHQAQYTLAAARRRRPKTVTGTWATCSLGQGATQPAPTLGQGKGRHCRRWVLSAHIHTRRHMTERAAPAFGGLSCSLPHRGHARRPTGWPVFSQSAK